MKKVLWEQLSVESAVPTNAYPSKAIFSVCTEQAGASDVAEVKATSSVTVRSLLAVLSVISFAFPEQSPKADDYSHLNFSNTQKVPIYLRLGRLIYYA